MLNTGPFAAFPDPDVMRSKYGKLLFNLGNIAEAALGRGKESQQLADLLRDEALGVLDAAGIAWKDVGRDDPRRDELMTTGPIEGVTRTGGSTAQSLARATGSIETDYLNGEMVLLGRLHGVPVPANEWACALAARMLREHIPAGGLDPSEVREALALLAGGDRPVP